MLLLCKFLKRRRLTASVEVSLSENIMQLFSTAEMILSHTPELLMRQMHSEQVHLILFFPRTSFIECLIHKP